MESSSRFVNIFMKFTRYKLIIASQGRGVCKVDHFLKAKHKGKLWCYVDKGSCKDEKKGRSSGMFWSFEACRKGQTVRFRRKLVLFPNISKNKKSWNIVKGGCDCNGNLNPKNKKGECKHRASTGCGLWSTSHVWTVYDFISEKYLYRGVL